MRNLSEVSLKNKTLVWYFVIATFAMGIFSYLKVGRMEDPQFTIREMVVTAAWPGATATQMEEQVTDKIERKIQDLAGLDYLRSYTRPGTMLIYVTLKDEYPKEKIRQAWHDVRNFCDDIKADLPEGVYGPFFDDCFDDVFGSIYAVTGDDYSYEELRQEAEKIRRRILKIKTVQKVELAGEQIECVYIEMEMNKLSELGISPMAIRDAVRLQNMISPTGMIDTETDNVYLRLTGTFENVENIKETIINAGGRTIRLGDIATIERRYTEPFEPKMYANGKKAIGIAVAMENGGNILELGNELNELMEDVKQNLPLGMEIHQISDQPKVVDESIGEFVGSLWEAVIIVLIVTLMSLGVRTGAVVAFCIPLVLAGTFCVMYALGIDLHKVSLGALIISLGLLVDDEMIAVEMMSLKLEQGYSRFEAACHAFKETAKPMLTGTLITCAGFIPIAFSRGNASEFCAALFPVIVTTLILSWIVSVMVTPLFGYYLIKTDENKPQLSLSELKKQLYENIFYIRFKNLLIWFLRHKMVVIGGTIGIFIGAVMLFGHIKKEFFPTSLRPEIIVEMTLPEGSSKKATEVEALRMMEFFEEKKENLTNYSLYVGSGAPRFVLTYEPVPPADNFAQFIVVAKNFEDREMLTEEIKEKLAEDFPNVRSSVEYIQMGPPADYPVMLRVSGDEKEKVREIAHEVGKTLSADRNLCDIHYDWNEKIKTIKVSFDQKKLQSMGLSSKNVSEMLYTELNGLTIAQYYKGDRTIDIQLRLDRKDREDIENIKNLPIYLGEAGYIPLSQIADVSFEAEDGLIWRRNLKPTITVRANILSGTPNDMTQKAYNDVKSIVDNLPDGYSIEPAGALEDAREATAYLMKPVPIMMLIIITLLMIELNSPKKLVITLLTLPLGIIGVAIGLFVFDATLGFVAEIGILALSGMIIRNSIILLDQIRLHLEIGETPWDAIIDSAVLRFRPIMLTAGSSILGMVPLIPSNFWGPMAIGIASGLLLATALTLLVVPTIYAIIYKVQEE